MSVERKAARWAALSFLVRRKGRVYVINKTQRKFKARQG